jgi:hypothetical protein
VGRVEHVDVDGHVHRPRAEPLPHPVDRGAQPLQLHVGTVHRGEAEPFAVRQIGAGVQRAADTHVQRVLAVDQALLGGPPERRAVGVGRTEVGVPGVEVGVEVQDGKGAVPLVHRAQQRKCDRVVAADGQQPRPVGGQVACTLVHLRDRGPDVEGVAGDVAGVGHLLGAERLHGQRRVVRPEQPGGLAYVSRAEPRAGTVADTAVERHSDDGDIGPGHLVEPRQVGERGRSGVSGHERGIDRAEDRAAGKSRRNLIGHPPPPFARTAESRPPVPAGR